jgi:3-dehydroquinate dehydratase II
MPPSKLIQPNFAQVLYKIAQIQRFPNFGVWTGLSVRNSTHSRDTSTGFCTLDAKSPNILVINGPNLNLLGTREPETYGSATLADIEAQLLKIAAGRADLEFLQSNAEHVLIDAIHAARGRIDFILINPGALTHTSIALRDAFLGVKIPFIELHLSNVHAREAFRQHSYLSDIAVGVITGFGAHSYVLALEAALQKMSSALRAA